MKPTFEPLGMPLFIRAGTLDACAKALAAEIRLASVDLTGLRVLVPIDELAMRELVRNAILSSTGATFVREIGEDLPDGWRIMTERGGFKLLVEP